VVLTGVESIEGAWGNVCNGRSIELMFATYLKILLTLEYNYCYFREMRNIITYVQEKAVYQGTEL
jgi:hypothetical protein